MTYRVSGPRPRNGLETAQKPQESCQIVVCSRLRDPATRPGAGRRVPKNSQFDTYPPQATGATGPLEAVDEIARADGPATATGPLENERIMTIEELHIAAIEKTIEQRTKAKRQPALTGLLEYAKTEATRVIVPDGRPILIWSDLHLRHANIIRYCSRPFKNAVVMDRSLMKAWRDHASDTAIVVNGGDVALSGRLTGKILKDVENAPGHKILVAGNHEVDKKSGKIRSHGHDEVCPMATFETDPPMVLTHVPLEEIPAGWINLHGHVHNNEERRSSRHINVCVEHTGYAPLAIEDLAFLGHAVLGGDACPETETIDRIRGAGRWKTI